MAGWMDGWLVGWLVGWCACSFHDWEHVVDKSGLISDWVIEADAPGLAYQSECRTQSDFCSGSRAPCGKAVRGPLGLSGPSCWSAGGNQPTHQLRRISFLSRHAPSLNVTLK